MTPKFSVLIGLLNFIPYIGSVLGVLFPMLMAIVQFETSSETLAVLLPPTVIQFVIGSIVDRFAMSSSLNLSPFVILVSLTVWTGLWGIPGAFLAVPITAVRPSSSPSFREPGRLWSCYREMASFEPVAGEQTRAPDAKIAT
ncbi:MAG: AI-2E family transporter [Betaproteobacteria bacterium]